MNGNNIHESFIHLLIHSKICIMIQRIFVENAKNNASTSNSSATIPTAQPLTSRFVEFTK